IVGNFAANSLSGGAGDDTLDGGKGDDTLSGGSGDDRLDGGHGADLMDGGAGDDLYLVDSTQDRIVELPRGGIDTVQVQAARYRFDANVENAVITRSSGSIVTGNELANRIGGGAGADTLAGGGGADTFVFDGLGAVDRITDFTHGVDKLVLQGPDFAGASLGGSLLYDPADGMLSMNGTDFLQLGTAFDHPALSPGDLHIV
ncbi:MAG TPA: hypothetical protein VFM30_05745, partial [Steroidobacteraceae bacterium]|nr:hypothetical protein [Steroidobacteraceae bacterium]